MTTKFEIIKLKAQAAMGNAEAMYLLGCDYLYGIGVKPDIQLAHSYLSKAADKGFAHGKDTLEYAFADKGRSIKLSSELDTVYEVICGLCQAADKGDPAALHLKNMDKLSDDVDDYMFNRGVTQMKQSADQNYAPALFSLGIVYMKGNRIKGKRDEGIRMLTNAAEQEYTPAVIAYANFFPEKAFPIIARIAKKEDADAEIFGLLSEYYFNGIIVDKDEKEGLRLLKKAEEKGYKDAALNLGITYEHGKCGESKNIKLAVAYYEKGVENDDPDCMNNLGSILELSDEYPQDHKRAFELYKRSAELGNGAGYNNLATCYKRGIGTDADPKKALECYEQAITAGDKAHSYWNLYLYYMDGVCLPRNYQKAVEWLQKGDEVGILQCTYQLSRHIKNGDGIDSDIKMWFSYLKKAADGGYEEAYKELADCYRYGFCTERDEKEAFELYEKASHNDIEALNNLAQCYTYGIGTERNLAKAFNLYKIGAEHGHAQSQYDLGICYRQGEGTKQDFNKAIEWYLKAIEQGHGGAMCNLGILYDNAIGVEKDLEKARKYYTMSAEAGEKQGQFCLADMYYQGRGVDQNYEEAVKWFKAAAEQGEPDSMFHLAICYNEGYGVEKDAQLMREYLFKAADKGWQPALDVIRDNNLDYPNAGSKDVVFQSDGVPRINSDKTPAEIILTESGNEYPLTGGWGYSVDTAVEILLDNGSEGVNFEYWFIKFRAHKELNFIGNTHPRYGNIDCLDVQQSLRNVNGKPYDVLRYIVKALPVSELGAFDNEWKEHNGFKDDSEGLKNFQDRVEEKAVGYQTECWFNISHFYGK